MIQQASVIAFWHNKMLPVWKYFSQFPKVCGVVSKSKDGQYIADLLESWQNYALIRGSSSADTKLVLKEMVEAAKHSIVLITPDGPRGEIYKFKAGAAVAAARAGSPLQYLTIEIKSKIVFQKSWDHFEVPLPFSLIKINVSKPIIIESDSRENIDSIIQQIEKEMNG